MRMRCKECDCDSPADGRTMGLCPRCLLARVLDVRQGMQSQMDRICPWPDAPSPESLSASLPQLEVRELLARGGMGLIYLARQRNLDRQVALKVLPADDHADQAASARFLAEARIMANLNHPNIVTAYEAGPVDDWLYLVMELVHGPNLRHILRREAKLAPREAITLAMQLCDALAYAHRHGVIHRDIKPENILLDPGTAQPDGQLREFFAGGGRARLADFGIAKSLAKSPRDLTLTAPHHCLGTPDYAAPECRRGDRTADASADIYAVGVLLYEMLAGHVPAGHFAPPSRLAAVNKRVDRVVLRALAADPTQRYADAAHLRRDLARAWPAKPMAFRRRAVAATVFVAISLGAMVVSMPLTRHATTPLANSAGRASGTTAGTASTAVSTLSPSGFAGPDIMALMPGDAIRVEWRGQWYSASVLQREGRRVRIHYEGWNSESDEWVGSDRVKW